MPYVPHRVFITITIPIKNKKMKQKILAFLIALTGVFGLQAQQVTLYEDCGYRGRSVSLPPGNYLASQHGIRVRELSSISIPAGMTVNLFTMDYFSGHFISMQRSSNCLTNERFNDQMVSIQIYNDATGLLGNNQAPVTVYSGCNFQGKSESLNEGSYSSLQMGFISMLSVRVTPGYGVIFRKESGFGSNISYSNEEFRSDNNCLKLLWGANVKAAYVYKLDNVYDGFYNTQPAQNFTEGAVAYSDPGYRGRSQILYPGAYRGYQLTRVGERNISSIMIARGYRAIAFSGSNFEGASVVINASNQNLHTGVPNWGNRIGSIVVERIGQGSVIVNPNPGNVIVNPNPGNVVINQPSTSNNAVTIYANPFFSGGSYSFTEGSYRGNQLLVVGMRNTSSIVVPPGFRARVFTGANFDGSSREITNTINDLGAEGAGWNKAISSMIVERIGMVGGNIPPPQRPEPFVNSVVAYADVDYRGASQTFTLGRYTGGMLTGVGQRTISSIQIPTGFKVTVFEGANFDGASRVFYYGSVQNLATEGNGSWNDRIASLVVQRADDNSPAAPPAPPPPGRPQPTMTGNDMVIAYADVYYGGASQVLPLGRTSASQLYGGVGVRTISSIKIPPGYQVTVFEGPNFDGQSRLLFFGSIDNLAAEGNGSWNDRISSVIVERK